MKLTKKTAKVFVRDEYTALEVVARTSEPMCNDGDIFIEYEFLDYYPEENTQEFQTCEWAVVGYKPEDEDESIPFEVVALFWEQEAADAFCSMLSDATGLPIGAPNEEMNR